MTRANTQPAATSIEAAQPMLQVRNLTITTASGGLLVNDVSFDLATGETIAVVGESGSGKSLTTRALVGLLPAGLKSSGEARFAGRDLLALPERELRGIRGARISLLMQDPFSMLNPLQTAFTSVAEGLSPQLRRNRRAVREEVYRRFAEVGLDGPRHAHRYPFQLSGGMRQRVAMAAALARDPELLIADEPTTALDATTQAEVLEMLKELQRRRQMAIMFVTHDLGVAFSISERVLVMYAGGLLEQGSSRDLHQRPEHPYTHGLLRSQLPVAQRVADLVSIPGRVPAAASVADRCAFADRCRWAADVCIRQRPPLRVTSSGHATACVRIDEIRDELRLGPVVAEPAPELPPAAEATPLLTVRDLTKAYRRQGGRRGETHTALKGVSFELTQGESVGLVGESGSGKTTIARCLLGLTQADSGSIVLDGLDVSRYGKLSRAQERRAAGLVQIVFQDPYSSLNPARSIGAALREAVSARGGASSEREPVELLDQVGLPASYAQRRPAQLSGGERQRVAIARAMALRPKLLICDEPVASLDVSVQADILDVLRTVSAQYGMSMLFITHDLAVARQMTERLLVLYHGDVVEEGPTGTVLDHPTHEYTARLVRSAYDHELPNPGEVAR